MGITGAIIAIAWTLTALATGLLMIINTHLALYLAAIFGLLGSGIVIYYKKNNASLPS